MVGFASSALISLKAPAWAGPHTHALLLLKSSHWGWEISAILGVNFPSWLTMPMNLRNSVIDLGVFISKTTEVLLGSADTPCASMIWPRNVRDYFLNSHLSEFSVNPAAWMH